ncbi:hypothetical protein B296_00039849 [Ensete ventricosum]|uniref:Uncharacterized protein n=1 Tax=Ensete ventricosum TaxID=4639 RepID=A0A426YJN5_ENSVE|nr:hypothetical protein B296_00039849 [Ensete ventricosum]
MEQRDHVARKGSRSDNRGDRRCKRAAAIAGDVGGGMDYGGWEEKEEGSGEGLATAGCVLSRAGRRQWQGGEEGSSVGISVAEEGAAGQRLLFIGSSLQEYSFHSALMLPHQQYLLQRFKQKHCLLKNLPFKDVKMGKDKQMLSSCLTLGM